MQLVLHEGREKQSLFSASPRAATPARCENTMGFGIYDAGMTETASTGSFVSSDKLIKSVCI
jgi:hypothetical protein